MLVSQIAVTLGTGALETLSHSIRSRRQAFVHGDPRNLQVEPFIQFFHANCEPLKLKAGNLHDWARATRHQNAATYVPVRANRMDHERSALDEVSFVWLHQCSLFLPVLSILIPERAGNPVINANSSRSGADQPDQDDDIHGFGQIEELVEPVEKRKPFLNRPNLDRRDRNDHLNDKSSAAQARKQPDDEQTAADEFDRRDEISHEIRKGYSGAGEGFVHLASAAVDEELVASRNSEKHAERNAGEQDRKLLPRTVSEQQ
jgi:hypothetical protein